MRTQQLKLYEVEASVDRGHHFTTLGEVQSFLDQIRDLEWYVRCYGTLVKRTEVQSSYDHRSHGRYNSAAAAGLIMLVPRPTIHTVLHELAHVLAWAVHGSQSHDPFFCRTLLELTFYLRGPEAWQNLRAAYEAGGIVHDPEVES